MMGNKAARLEREAFALELIEGPGNTGNAAEELQAKYRISERQAYYDLHAARERLCASFSKKADAARLRIMAQIERVIQDNPTTVPLHLAAISKMIDLLGVAAPQKIEATVTSLPYDPIAAMTDDPELRERALELQKDIGNADEALHAESTGEDCPAGVEVPPPPPSPRSGSDGDAHEPDKESAGG